MVPIAGLEQFLQVFRLTRLGIFLCAAGVERAGQVPFQAARDAHLQLELRLPQHDAAVNLPAPACLALDDEIAIGLLRPEHTALFHFIVFTHDNAVDHFPERIWLRHFPTGEVFAVEDRRWIIRIPGGPGGGVQREGDGQRQGVNEL